MPSKKTEIAELFASFEDCRFEHEGQDAWRARNIMQGLGYATWDKGFRSVVQRAWDACEAAGVDPRANFLTGDGERAWHPGEVFREASKNPQGGRPSEDVILTRRAAYLVAMNGDPRKPEVAFAQHYFAAATRTLEKLQQRMLEAERLVARGELTETEARFQAVLFEHNVDGTEIGKIRSLGDQALFGGHDTAAMKRKWGITVKNKPLADHAPEVVIRAKQLSSAITTHNVQSNELRGEPVICAEHVENNRSVREMVKSRGIILEDVKPEEDIKKVERRHAAEVRKLSAPEKTKKPKKQKESQAEQSKRFIETARELECDESGETFKRAIRKVAKAKVPKVKPKANKITKTEK